MELLAGRDAAIFLVLAVGYACVLVAMNATRRRRP